jgi:hypothetical protein
MIDFYTVQLRGHRRNIERYCRLLALNSPISSGSSALRRNTFN